MRAVSLWIELIISFDQVINLGCIFLLIEFFGLRRFGKANLIKFVEIFIQSNHPALLELLLFHNKNLSFHKRCAKHQRIIQAGCDTKIARIGSNGRLLLGAVFHQNTRHTLIAGINLTRGVLRFRGCENQKSNKKNKVSDHKQGVDLL